VTAVQQLATPDQSPLLADLRRTGDEYKQRVEAAIQEKVEGHEAVVATAPTSSASTGNVIDLMAALRASLEKNASPGRNERKGAKGAGTVTPIARKAPRKRRN